jgi:N-acetylmuramoyl-L-alanine amidase
MKSKQILILIFLSLSCYNPVQANERPLVVLDAGHGGDDLGAVGVENALEKDVVLRIAKNVQILLEDRLRARVVLTRDSDSFISLADRTRIANENKADLFISIHANASEQKNAQGIETYYLDNTKDRSSLKLAERENKSLEFGASSETNKDLQFVFSDLIQNVKLEPSIALAHRIQSTVVNKLSRSYSAIKDLGVKKAPFYVLVGAHMPCILVEVSFIDHPIEGKRLGSTKYQDLLSTAIYEGILKHFIRTLAER